MRLAFIALLGILIYGCLGSGGGGTGADYHKNLTAAQLLPFYNAGCSYYSGNYLYCPNVSFTSQFHCFSDSPRIMNEGAGLEPALPLLECRVDMYRSNLSEDKAADYFFCSGGMLRACTSYIAYEDGNFVQIKNATELAERAAPIASETEAINYVLLSKDVIDTVERPLESNFTASAEKNADGFLVTAYHYSPFGCYSKLDYEEVKYQVSTEGKIEEKSRKVVYTKDLGYMICVD